MNIAIIAGNQDLKNVLHEAISSCGHDEISCADIAEALSASVDMILLEWREGAHMPDVLHSLEVATSQASSAPIVVFVPAGGITAMRRARAAGAADVLFCPPDLYEIQAEIKEFSPQQENLSRIEITKFREIARESLVGESPAFQKCLNELKLAARCDANVLLIGETGTGKEMFARAVHQLSQRSGSQYLPVNCASLPETLLENELFGSVKGAFTGATGDHCGRFELVGAGTLLLDEIGSISIALQAKLLRVIEQRVFQRLGDNKNRPFHGRLICATSVDLQKAMDEGLFRRDLLGRIDQFRIVLPPLRERQIDIPILTRHFLRKHAKGRNIEVSRSVFELLDAYEFPRNVRQLENSVISALAHLKAGSVILPKHLPAEIGSIEVRGSETRHHIIRVPVNMNYKAAVKHACQEVDVLFLPQLLQKHHGNQSLAAAEAGIDRKTFAARIKEILKGEGPVDSG